MSRVIQFTVPDRLYWKLLLIANDLGYKFDVGEFVQDMALTELAEILETYDT